MNAAIVNAQPFNPISAGYEKADWQDLRGLAQDSLTQALPPLLTSCAALVSRHKEWQAPCEALRAAQNSALSNTELLNILQAQLQPWRAKESGLVTGYYEPIFAASREKTAQFAFPLLGVPDDLIVDGNNRWQSLGENLRRPYPPRGEINRDKANYERFALAWLENPFDALLVHIQGSGQVIFTDGSRLRLAYAEHNGYAYASVANYLLQTKQISAAQASLQGLRAWAMSASADGLQQAFDSNPRFIFFKPETANNSGPKGALGVPLTSQRSAAADRNFIPLGSPFWLDTTQPNSAEPLQRLMIAQDVGNAIRGAARVDFYWGEGAAAEEKAGKMKQSGRVWLFWPK